MDTTLFYAFSTISQTLAGAIGLLAAFLLYHLTQLEGRLRAHLELLYSRYPGATETVDLEFMWEHYDVPGLLDYFEADRLDQLSGGEGLDKTMHLKPAVALWQSRQDALRQIRAALIWTAAVVLFALLMLAFARLLGCHTYISVTVLVLGVSGVAWCFWLYSRLILAAAGSTALGTSQGSKAGG